MPETLLLLGASSDIGGALIRALPIGFGKVFAQGYRSMDRLQALARERPDLALEAVSVDLSDETQTQAMLNAWLNRDVRPTRIAHLPAPAFGYARLKELSWDRVQREIDVQCRSLFLLFKTFLPIMARQGGGKVTVLLSRVAVEPPPRFLTHYTMAKAALWGLVQSAAAEFADRNILINAVSPAMVDTRFIGELPEAVRQELALKAEGRRFLTSDEVAEALWRQLSQAIGAQTGRNEPL